LSRKKQEEGNRSQDLDRAIESSRRDFIRKVTLAGAVTVTGGAAIYSGHRFEKAKHRDGFVKVLTEDNRLVEIPVEQMRDFKPDLKMLQTRGRYSIDGRRWVMVIDLSRCRNARKCVEACQSAHHLRPYEYHINTLVMQKSANTPAFFMPKPCQHCDNPPCVSVCPVDATFKRQDGIVLIDNERCIGCRFCIAACPYSARIFHWQEPSHHEADNGKEYDVELNVPQKKCTVTNGTTKATVRLSELQEKNAGYRLMPELGTKPRVYYLPPKNKIFEFEEGEKREYKEEKT